MYLHGDVVQSHRPELLWPHIRTSLSTPPFMCVCCESNPLPASGAQPPEVRSRAANTQADATLPHIGVRGGANGRITPGPHSQQFGGARQRWKIWVNLSTYPQPTHEQHPYFPCEASETNSNVGMGEGCRLEDIYIYI